MAPEFRKLEFFEHIEAGEGFGQQKSRIFFAGANFIAGAGGRGRRGAGMKFTPAIPIAFLCKDVYLY